ncbi:uncharacterized protein LOC128278665 [Anopheles cruzii]|uniref:uncharacterized protein LOC128278665 n=1 Tax=Anopheles cruzii TaxID=68878 RepID=UPI0022EC2E2B|nr:uncharacterized protein LOC128278665 [Anopheles cruzii]
MASPPLTRPLRSSKRLSLTLSVRKRVERRKSAKSTSSQEPEGSTQRVASCEPTSTEVNLEPAHLSPTRDDCPSDNKQSVVPEIVIISSDDENDSRTPTKSSIREFFTPEESTRLRSNCDETYYLTASTRKQAAPQTLPRKAAGKVRRKICPTTNIKMLTKKYFDDSQKRITNFFNKQNEDTERVGYCRVLQQSVMPTIVTGDMDVEQMLHVNLEEGEHHLRISAVTSLAEIPEFSGRQLGPTEIMERIERVQSACYDPDREDWNMERVAVPIVTTPLPADDTTGDSGIAFAAFEDAHGTDVIKNQLKGETVRPRSATGKESTNRTKHTKPSTNRSKVAGAKVPKSAPKKERKKVVCPKYKIIAGTTFAVDGFRYGDIEGVTHYFLTHFHADHYIGLKKSFSKPLIMSPITARLVKTFINVPEEHYLLIDLHQAIVIDGVEIIALDANHCPGGIMFLFRLPNGTNILHTGDFRASPEMEEYPELWNFPIDCIYLDTTYLSSKYAFKPQCESVAIARDTVLAFLKKNIGAKVLIVCGSYLIGKEKVWMELAIATGMKVWTEPNRWKALTAIADPMQLSLLVTDPAQADIHVLAMNKISYDELGEYLDQFPDRYDCVIALRPSGWEKNSKPQYRGRINIVGIEYSEHSSFDELKRFVQFVRPREVISTVPYGNANQSRTPTVPMSWYTGDIRPQRKALQLSITSFITANGAQAGGGSSKKPAAAVLEQESVKVEPKQKDHGTIKVECSAQDIIELDSIEDENEQRSEQGEFNYDSDWLP